MIQGTRLVEDSGSDRFEADEFGERARVTSAPARRA